MGLDVQASDACELEQTFYLWPENVVLWHLWHQLQTQWRVGAEGRDGLDYASVLAYMRDVACIRPRKFAQAFACLQAMERAVLDAWAKQRER